MNCGNTHFKCRYDHRICHSRVKMNSTNWAALNIRVFVANLIEHCRAKAACKRTQQLPTLLRACWQWCANGCNNSQQCWDLQYIVGRIQPISLCKPCVMRVRGPNNVGRALQTDPTLLRYASAITEQEKCWEMLAETFDRFETLHNTQQYPTTSNRVYKRTEDVTSNNVGSCWPTMLRPFARGLIQ